MTTPSHWTLHILPYWWWPSSQTTMVYTSLSNRQKWLWIHQCALRCQCHGPKLAIGATLNMAQVRFDSVKQSTPVNVFFSSHFLFMPQCKDFEYWGFTSRSVWAACLPLITVLHGWWSFQMKHYSSAECTDTRMTFQWVSEHVIYGMYCLQVHIIGQAVDTIPPSIWGSHSAYPKEEGAGNKMLTT